MGMNMQDFVAAVADMRRTQRRYFCTREREALALAKECEAAVDRFLDEMQRPTDCAGLPETGGE